MTQREGPQGPPTVIHNKTLISLSLVVIIISGIVGSVSTVMVLKTIVEKHDGDIKAVEIRTEILSERIWDVYLRLAKLEPKPEPK